MTHSQEHGWVVCSPGDPNDKQLRTIHRMAGDRLFCMTHWNADTEAVRVSFTGPFDEWQIDVDKDGHGWSTHHGEFIAIDLTANNAHCYPDKDPPPDFGWGVCKQGSGLQAFGDGYMVESVARARAAALNAGKQATDVPNDEEVLAVLVEMKSDTGDTASEVGVGGDVDAAIASAVVTIQAATGDDSWTMNEWKAI